MEWVSKTRPILCQMISKINKYIEKEFRQILKESELKYQLNEIHTMCNKWVIDPDYVLEIYKQNQIKAANTGQDYEDAHETYVHNCIKEIDKTRKNHGNELI